MAKHRRLSPVPSHRKLAFVIDDLTGFICALRRDLHRRPEVGLELPRTQERVLAALGGLPLDVTTGTASGSVTAVLRGGKPGHSVLLRADMDALPMTEKTGLAFAATNGSMHACGHDLHTAMLVGAAHLLADRQPALRGDVILAFQAGEEGWEGAKHMLEDGLLTAAGAERPVAAFALHVTSAMLPSGVLAGRAGPTMSAVDVLRVEIRGRGGHGSAPHRAVDPLPAAAAMLLALQTAVTREFDVFDPVVVTVGRLQAGTAHNVIPDVAAFEATVRSFTPETHLKLAKVLPRVCHGIALAHGVEVDVAFEELYPATVNDSVEASWALTHGRELLGEEHVLQLANPLTGSEDFSRILQEIPGAMLFLGATPPGLDPATAPFNHAPEADFDESVLPIGARLYASLAEQRLASAG